MIRKGITESTSYIKLPLIDEEEASLITNPQAPPNHLHSLVALKITPTQTPDAIAHVIVSKNNNKKGNENWKCVLFFHRGIKDYLDENEKERFQIKFVFSGSTYDTLTTRFSNGTTTTLDGDFMEYKFTYNHPIKSGINQDTFKTFSVRVGFKSNADVDHHLFNMDIFQEDFPVSFKLKTKQSFYEALNEKEEEKDFAQYWDSLCATRTLGLPKIDYKFLTRDEKLTSLIKDPWFCLFSLLEKDEETKCISSLKMLNGKVDWEKLKSVSQKIKNTTSLNRNQLQEGLDKVMGEVSYFLTLGSSTFELEQIVNLLSMVQKIRKVQ